MLHVLFDYGLNVKLCIAAGAVQTVTWAAFVVRRRHPGRGRMLLFLVRTSLSSVCSTAMPSTEPLDPRAMPCMAVTYRPGAVFRQQEVDVWITNAER